jgi:hypothetical protein
MTKFPGKKSTRLSALIAKTILLTVFFDGTIGSAPSPEKRGRADQGRPGWVLAASIEISDG